MSVRGFLSRLVVTLLEVSEGEVVSTDMIKTHYGVVLLFFVTAGNYLWESTSHCERRLMEKTH